MEIVENGEERMGGVVSEGCGNKAADAGFGVWIGGFTIKGGGQLGAVDELIQQIHFIPES